MSQFELEEDVDQTQEEEPIEPTPEELGFIRWLRSLKQRAEEPSPVVPPRHEDPKGKQLRRTAWVASGGPETSMDCTLSSTTCETTTL